MDLDRIRHTYYALFGQTDEDRKRSWQWAFILGPMLPLMLAVTFIQASQESWPATPVEPVVEAARKARSWWHRWLP